ncbi:BTB/POZ protein [Parasitella parasitica]|nr:BTB/POZ protein [Parasitella parasitica]
MNNLLNLNVGGQLYTTYYDTLKISLYFRNLRDNIPQPDCIRTGHKETTCYFIDRDPEVFCDIMHYLRTWEVRSNDKAYLKILQNEAKFYGFDDLVKKITNMLTDSINSDKLFKEIYLSKDPKYLQVDFNTTKFDSLESQTLVQAFQYNYWMDNHSECKVVLKN